MNFPFFTKTLDSIIAGFSRVISDLEAHQQRKLQEHHEHTQQMCDHSRMAEEARAEAERAEIIGTNIRKMLNFADADAA